MARLPKKDLQLTYIECLLNAIDQNEKEADSEELKENRQRFRKHLFDQAVNRVVQLLRETDPNPYPTRKSNFLIIFSNVVFNNCFLEHYLCFYV